MSSEVMVALVTAVLGLTTAAILALVNSWVATRAGIDENLRAERLEVYPELWGSTRAVSRWPRGSLTRLDLEQLHGTYRDWYYSTGGLYLSEPAGGRYGDVQELIAALLKHAPADSGSLLADASYTALMDSTSALRTALTEDLDTRKRTSLRETWRRARWHRTAAAKARQRIATARLTTDRGWSDGHRH